MSFHEQEAQAECSLPVVPGRGLGPIVLGSRLHELLSTIKASPRAFPSVDLTYSASDPLACPVILKLARNGIRLRFDGAEQRLKFVEVLEFNHTHFTYNGIVIQRSFENVHHDGALSKGPSYRSVVKLFGPTFPGEYLPPHTDENVSTGTYILSYPGIAFSFSVQASTWSSANDQQDLLSSPATSPCKSICLFQGRSWAECRQTMSDPVASKTQRSSSHSRSKSEDVANSIEFARIYGEGRVELVRTLGPSFMIQLSETSVQDLISELGPPDAIYRKNDRRVAIHKAGSRRNSRLRNASDYTSSANTDNDESDLDNDPAMDAEAKTIAEAEEYFNYFKLGFDIFMSTPTSPSQPSPTMPEAKSLSGSGNIIAPAKNNLAATKIIFHGNVPGSWNFDRHNRCRWTLEHVPTAQDFEALTSEMKFGAISARLIEVFRSTYTSVEDARAQQRPILLNRDWGESPSSSCELVGGWEEDIDVSSKGNIDGPSISGISKLFGFPGMVFEVLDNDCVDNLTVF